MKCIFTRMIQWCLGGIALVNFLNALSFEEFDLVLEGKPSSIEISGFAYQAHNGRWILASEPHLRLCCIGSTLKTKQQVYLEGELPLLKPNEFVTLKGEFFIAPEYSSKGELTAYYHLDHVKVIPKQWPWVTLSGMGVVGILFTCMRGISKRLLRR